MNDVVADRENYSQGKCA